MNSGLEHQSGGIQLYFSADEALMYLIQQVTKLPTEEILGFFYDFGMRVASIGIENMKSNRGIRKDIRDVFPGSSVPFKFLVKGSFRRHYNLKAGQSTQEEIFHGSMEVTFPDNTRSVNQKALMEKIIERTLLDGESLPNFPQPVSKTPKLYIDLIQEVIRNKHGTTENIHDTRHTRQVGPANEVVVDTSDGRELGSNEGQAGILR